MLQVPPCRLSCLDPHNAGWDPQLTTTDTRNCSGHSLQRDPRYYSRIICTAEVCGFTAQRQTEPLQPQSSTKQLLRRFGWNVCCHASKRRVTNTQNPAATVNRRHWPNALHLPFCFYWQVRVLATANYHLQRDPNTSTPVFSISKEKSEYPR